MDEFSATIVDGGYGYDKYLYQQVIFSEWDWLVKILIIFSFYIYYI